MRKNEAVTRTAEWLNSQSHSDFENDVFHTVTSEHLGSTTTRIQDLRNVVILAQRTVDNEVHPGARIRFKQSPRISYGIVLQIFPGQQSALVVRCLSVAKREWSTPELYTYDMLEVQH